MRRALAPGDRTGERKWPVAASMFVGALAFYASYLLGPGAFAASYLARIVAGAAMYAGPFFAIIPELAAGVLKLPVRVLPRERVVAKAS